jgi:hypothetical protein
MLHDELFCLRQVPLLKCKQMNFPLSVLETQLGGMEFSKSFTVLPPCSVVRLCLFFGKGLGLVVSLAGLLGP